MKKKKAKKIDIRERIALAVIARGIARGDLPYHKAWQKIKFVLK